MYYNKKDNRILHYHQLKSELNASFPRDMEKVDDDWYLIHDKPIPPVFGKNIKLTDCYIEDDVCYQRQEYEDIPLNILKTRLTDKINQWMRNESFHYLSDYPEEERATFPQQLLEAQAYLKDNTTEVPFITTLAQERQKSIDAIAQGIVENAEIYAKNMGTLVGRCRELHRSIKDSLTVEELEEIYNKLP